MRVCVQKTMIKDVKRRRSRVHRDPFAQTLNMSERANITYKCKMILDEANYVPTETRMNLTVMLQSR